MSATATAVFPRTLESIDLHLHHHICIPHFAFAFAAPQRCAGPGPPPCTWASATSTSLSPCLSVLSRQVTAAPFPFGVDARSRRVSCTRTALASNQSRPQAERLEVGILPLGSRDHSRVPCLKAVRRSCWLSVFLWSIAWYLLQGISSAWTLWISCLAFPDPDPDPTLTPPLRGPL